MKVKELIDKLKEFPQDVDVSLNGYTWYEDDCRRQETCLYEGAVEELEYDKLLNMVIIHGEDIYE